mmetsp:Transcript_97589/g.254486  ORF Transcript_97589/g.254486 Transcript_97589/m.254486 type:complete len:308 (-) Transcript_97589:179-1102(-)
MRLGGVGGSVGGDGHVARAGNGGGSSGGTSGRDRGIAVRLASELPNVARGYVDLAVVRATPADGGLVGKSGSTSMINTGHQGAKTLTLWRRTLPIFAEAPADHGAICFPNCTTVVAPSNHHGVPLAPGHIRLSIMAQAPAHGSAVPLPHATGMVFAHGHREEPLLRGRRTIVSLSPAHDRLIAVANAASLGGSCSDRLKALALGRHGHVEGVGTPTEHGVIGPQAAVMPVAGLQLYELFPHRNRGDTALVGAPAHRAAVRLAKAAGVLGSSGQAAVPLTGRPIADLSRYIPTPAHSRTSPLRQATGV